MKDDPNSFQKLLRKQKISFHQATIYNPCGENLLFHKEERRRIVGGRDIESIKKTNSIILQGTGERVNSPEKIKGICSHCGCYITRYSARYCRDCGGLFCSLHSRYIEDEKRYVCIHCSRKLKRKRAIRSIFRVLTSPFIEREDNEGVNND